MFRKAEPPYTLWLILICAESLSSFRYSFSTDSLAQLRSPDGKKKEEEEAEHTLHA